MQEMSYAVLGTVIANPRDKWVVPDRTPRAADQFFAVANLQNRHDAYTADRDVMRQSFT